MATQTEVLERIENEISKLKTNDFNIFFFTVDTKNVPSGSVVYSYELALALHKLGYKVTMLYQLENEMNPKQKAKLIEKGKYNPMDDNVFCGVGDWLGQEYADLPHLNIAKKNAWSTSPSDFLFIPEAFASLMSQTYIYKIPCQRYVLLYNFDYVTDMIPFGASWLNFGIRDCVATTDLQAKLIQDVMPFVRTNVLNPYIPEYFRKPVAPKKLIVNVISKRQSDVKKLMKTFYWKYPVYKFIAFKDLRGMAREHYADALKEGAITVWIDTETPFGFGAVEAMRCNNIVIGKIPENNQDWMVNENDELRDNVIWFDNMSDAPDILADVIGSWMQDEIPQVIYDEIEKTNTMYTKEEWDKNVENFATKMIETRLVELETFKSNIINKNKKDEE
jgi:hypothetical protein